ncbi:MAG: DUF502 domain-containing protein [Halodesulfurarchaeum sp.]
MDIDMQPSEAIRTGFVTGFVFIAPLAVSVIVILIAYQWLVGLIEPILRLWLDEVGALEGFLSVVSLFVGITVLGLMVREWATDRFLVTFDRVMEHVPVLRSIYSPTRRAATALIEHGDQFDRVALVEWPRTDVRTIGFVTDETPERVQTHIEGEAAHYDVFVPMSPNPMGGFLAVVPESVLTMTDLTVKEGLQLVITTGLSGDEELTVEELQESVAD